MNRVRLLLLAGLLTGGWTVTVAQQPDVGYSDTVRIRSMTRPPRWVVSLVPLALLDPENTVQAGFERLLGGRHSVLGEIGYGPASLNVWRSYSSSFRNGIGETWRGRAEWRVYTRRIRSNRRWQPGRVGRTVIRKPLGNYAALSVFYKQTNASESGRVERGCEDGSCQYFQRFQSRVVKYIGGAHAKVGKQVSLNARAGNGRLLMDTYIGIGVRYRFVKNYGLPEPEDGGRYFFNNRNAIFNDNLFSFAPVRMSATVGFRIGYVF